MDSRVLLLVTALLIENKKHSLAHAFHRPTLSLDSLSDVILNGESVTITCRSPRPSLKHYFFKDSRFVRYENVPARLYTTNYLISYIKHADGGKYVCKYVAQIGVKWLQSLPSNPVYLNVKDQLPKPTISLNVAPGVFTKGETVWIRCTGRLRSTGSKFHLYREGASYPLEIGESEGSQQAVTFAIRNITENNDGKYKCLYQRVVSGHTASSPFSDSIQVTVTDIPPKPLIYSTPRSAVVHRGTTIQFMCEGPDEYPGSTFYLYQNSSTRSVQSQTAGEGNHSVTFSINVTEQSEEVFYTCGYNTEVLGRSLHSPSSHTVKVVVRNLTKTEAIPLDGCFQNSSWDNATCTFASPCHYTVQYYMEAITRLCLSALVLIMMVIVIVEYLVNIEAGRGVLSESGDAYLRTKQSRLEMRYQ